jgi:hypothetical protein
MDWWTWLLMGGLGVLAIGAVVAIVYVALWIRRD